MRELSSLGALNYKKSLIYDLNFKEVKTYLNKKTNYERKIDHIADVKVIIFENIYKIDF